MTITLPQTELRGCRASSPSPAFPSGSLQALAGRRPVPFCTNVPAGRDLPEGKWGTGARPLTTSFPALGNSHLPKIQNPNPAALRILIDGPLRNGGLWLPALREGRSAALSQPYCSVFSGPSLISLPSLGMCLFKQLVTSFLCPFGCQSRAWGPWTQKKSRRTSQHSVNLGRSYLA